MVEAVATQAIEVEAADLNTDAQAFEVATATDYKSAGDFLVNEIKKYRRRVADLFDPHIKRAHGAHKELLADKKKHEAPAIEAEQIVKARMLEWKKAEDARAEEERRVAEAAAREEAEKAQLARAEAAEAEGNKAKADAILDEPVRPTPVAKREAAPKLAGVSVRKIWTYEVVDAAKIPRDYLKLDEQKIGQTVRTMKKQAEKLIPGIRAIERDSMAAGR